MRNYMSALKRVEEAGVKAWLVGDTARMIAMGLQPESLTLAAESCDLKALAANLGNGTVDVLGGFPVLRATVLEMPVEVFPLQGGSIEEDLARRDFSMNAVAFRSDGGVVDPFGGRHDIRNRVIRLTGDDIELVRRDPLRIVRMLRFAAELSMDIFWKTETDVRDFIEANPERVRDTAPERWGREILLGMRSCPCTFVRLCDGYRLFPLFLPEFEELKDSVEPRTGLTLFDHAMTMLQVVQNRLRIHKIKENDAFALAGLFCRVGTKTLDAGDPQPVVRLASGYLRRWNIPSETIDRVSAIITNYRSLHEPKTEEELCGDVLRHGLEAVKMTLEFASCSALAERYPSIDIVKGNRWRLEQVTRRFDSVARRMDGASRFLTGEEVMDLLKLSPGRKVGELLNGLDMAVGIGHVASRSEAEAWVLRRGSAL
mgnify:FL=1